MTPNPCPTPWKQEYRSAAKAKRYNKRAPLPGQPKKRLRPYLCPSGEHWHLTSQSGCTVRSHERVPEPTAPGVL